MIKGESSFSKYRAIEVLKNMIECLEDGYVESISCTQFIGYKEEPIESESSSDKTIIGFRKVPDGRVYISFEGFYTKGGR